MQWLGFSDYRVCFKAMKHQITVSFLAFAISNKMDVVHLDFDRNFAMFCFIFVIFQLILPRGALYSSNVPIQPTRCTNLAFPFFSPSVSSLQSIILPSLFYSHPLLLYSESRYWSVWERCKLHIRMFGKNVF